MKSLAAILVELNQPLEIVELEIPPLKAGQVLVELAFSGVCHTQLLEARGYKGADPFLPHCLGHEGSGLVRELGAGVKRVKEGDRVILSWMKGAGADVPGTVYQWDSKKVNAGGVTTFNTLAVVSENRLTPLPEQIDMQSAALLGCAVPTGCGAVFNTARVRAGESLAVFGAGGIGLFALQAARASGAYPIIAVDVLEEKLNLASRLGATHCLLSTQDGESAVQRIKSLVPGGVDYAIEASGRPSAMLQALESVRNQGGVAVVVGNARSGELLSIDPREFNMGKQLRGTWGGDNKPEQDFPRYCRLVQAKKLELELLINKTYKLEEINLALNDLEQGLVARPIIALS